MKWINHNHVRVSLVLLGSFLLSLPLYAHEFNDDHGDDRFTATPIPVDGSTNTASLEIDVDEDWFSFQALPEIVYGILVQTGTVWDVNVSVIAPDGVTLIADANTARSASMAEVTWTNTGSAGTYYVKIDPFIEFTTGDYHLAVSSLNLVDTDGDGLPDFWELDHLDTITNGAHDDVDLDGFDNLEEYHLGSDPANPDSGLFITQIKDEGIEYVAISWPATLFGVYRVLATTNLPESLSWTILGTNMHTLGTGLETYLDSGNSDRSNRFYRVEFLY